MDYIFIGLFILIFVVGIYMLFRNNKVYKTRIYILDKSMDLYHLLPSYRKMLYGFKPSSRTYWLDYTKNKKEMLDANTTKT